MKKREQRKVRLEMLSREFRIALFAGSIVDEQLRANPSLLADYDLLPTDFLRFRRNLEATYLIRLFAEFESALRDAWNGIGRETQPQTTDLLDGLTARRGIPWNVQQAAHRVRRHRNAIVHEDFEQVAPVPFDEASRDLLRFLSHMPADW